MSTVNEKRYLNKSERKKIYKTPEILLKVALNYFDTVDSEPWYRHEPMKTGEMSGKTMQIPVSRPYSVKGLCVFLGFPESHWLNMRKSEDYADFRDVLDFIEDIILTQQFEGAVTGTFNSSVISRMSGAVGNPESAPINRINISVVDKETLDALNTLIE